MGGTSSVQVRGVDSSVGDQLIQALDEEIELFRLEPADPSAKPLPRECSNLTDLDPGLLGKF